MTRDLKLDGIKFVMIFLVVLGHIGYNDCGIGINVMIYSFHMPVFIFLSGYFTSQYTTNEKQISWFKKTFIIYALAQLAHFLLSIGLGYYESLLKHELFDSSLVTWKVLISPRLALWYLVCLIYWRFSIWKVFPNIDDKKLLCVSCVLAFVSGIIPIDHDFAFQRAFAFFPFFVIGYIFRKSNLMSKLDDIPYVYAIVGLIIGLVIARFLPPYMPKLHYSSLLEPIQRIIQSVLGLFLCLSIIRVLRTNFIGKFAKYGIYTLWIYIGHTYFIVLGEKVFYYHGISFNLVTAILLSLIYCTFFICLSKMINYIKNKYI